MEIGLACNLVQYMRIPRRIKAPMMIKCQCLQQLNWRTFTARKLMKTSVVKIHHFKLLPKTKNPFF